MINKEKITKNNVNVYKYSHEKFKLRYVDKNTLHDWFISLNDNENLEITDIETNSYKFKKKLNKV